MGDTSWAGALEIVLIFSLALAFGWQQLRSVRKPKTPPPVPTPAGVTAAPKVEGTAGSAKIDPATVEPSSVGTGAVGRPPEA